MSAVSKTSGQATFEGFANVISSPASADGLTLYDSPAGLIIGMYGPALVRASLSARQAKEKGLLTSGIYGRPGSISSRSADLQLSLESRLMQRLDAAGSTLFSLTWKALVTPSLRSLYLLRALAPRTAGTDFGSWPTPMAGTPAQKGYNEAGNNDSSRKTVALLAGWATPSARDWKSASGSQEFLAERSEQARGKPLSEQVFVLTNWPTPVVNDATGSDYAYNRGNHESITLKLGGVAKLAVTGESPIGSTAETKNGGQLNPAHSRWLMGYRPEWDDCAVMAMPSSRKLPRK